MITQKKTISIITPTYNHERFVAQCIESVLGQDYTNWEMIIIDDGSTDNTPNIIKRYTTDKRIKYVRQEHRGIDYLCDSYNKALSLSEGEYIAICEGDDWWPPYKLTIQLEDLEKNRDAVMSYGYTYVVSIDGELEDFIPQKGIPLSARENNPVGKAALYMMTPWYFTFAFPVSVVIRKTALEEIGGFQRLPYIPIVDYPTFLQLTLKGRFVFNEKVLGFWRRHPESTTKKKIYLILKGVYEYMQIFLKENRNKLNVEDKELERIFRKWDDFKAIQHFLAGAYCLNKNRWDKAIRSFREGLSLSKGFTEKSALLVGIVFAHLHLRIDPLLRLFGYGSVNKILDKAMIIDKDSIDKELAGEKT